MQSDVTEDCCSSSTTCVEFRLLNTVLLCAKHGKYSAACVMAKESRPSNQLKQYDYLLKFLLVGDSDVGKQEILSGLEDASSESPFCGGYGKWARSVSSVWWSGRF